LLGKTQKDTVSVLYWYEELSSSKLAIFGRAKGKISETDVANKVKDTVSVLY
jgi:hypothetical protein